MSLESNDNDVVARPIGVREPDAHGQAAFLLVESLIHGLVAQSAITLDAAIEIVEIATEVKIEIAEDLGDSPATLQRSLGMLHGLSDSLRSDRQV